jgi:hypothetical protein
MTTLPPASSPVLRAEEFAPAWGGSLVRLAQPCSALPAETNAWLAAAGLPSMVRVILWQLGLLFDPADKQGPTHKRVPSWAKPIGTTWQSTNATMQFARAAGPLITLASEDFGTWRPPSAWHQHWVIGEEQFVNGSALWTVHQETGCVYRVDVELSTPVSLANTSLARFCSSLVCVADWSARCPTPEAASSPSNVATLSQALSAIDPAALQDRSSFWFGQPSDGSSNAVTMFAA